jgi:hypothetical protein
MRWLDDGKEMRWFAKQRDVKFDEHKKAYRVISLYNIHSGVIFCQLTIWQDLNYKIEVLYFFEEIKEELYTMIMRDISSEEEPYSYDKWIQPIFREKKLDLLLT